MIQWARVSPYTWHISTNTYMGTKSMDFEQNVNDLENKSVPTSSTKLGMRGTLLATGVVAGSSPQTQLAIKLLVKPSYMLNEQLVSTFI